MGIFRSAALVALAAGLTAGFPLSNDTFTQPRQEPDNRGRRSEKSAERLAKAEEKRKRRAGKRLKSLALPAISNTNINLSEKP